MTPSDKETSLNIALKRAFQFEDDRYQCELNALIDENDQLSGHWSVGFNYKGADYGRDGQVVNPRRTIPLAGPLIPKMGQLAQTRQAVEQDRAVVRQCLRKAIELLADEQGLRDALPECLVRDDPTLSKLPRTREPGWVLAGFERDHRQFMQAVTKIEMYCSLKFLY